MELRAIEREICVKAREWIEAYGEDFLIELISDYLHDGASRLARLRQAFNAGDVAALTLEAHTFKSSSANVGAESLSTLAKQLEEMGRDGARSALANEVTRFEEQFALVKASLEKLRDAPSAFLTQVR